MMTTTIQRYMYVDGELEGNSFYGIVMDVKDDIAEIAIERGHNMMRNDVVFVPVTSIKPTQRKF